MSHSFRRYDERHKIYFSKELRDHYGMTTSKTYRIRTMVARVTVKNVRDPFSRKYLSNGILRLQHVSENFDAKFAKFKLLRSVLFYHVISSLVCKRSLVFQYQNARQHKIIGKCQSVHQLYSTGRNPGRRPGPDPSLDRDPSPDGRLGRSSGRDQSSDQSGSQSGSKCDSRSQSMLESMFGSKSGWSQGPHSSLGRGKGQGRPVDRLPFYRYA